MDQIEHLGIVAKGDRLADLQAAIERAGYTAEPVHSVAESITRGLSVVVDRHRFATTREFAAMLGRLSSVSGQRIAIGVTRTPAEQAETLRELASVRTGMALDLCLEDQLEDEIESRIIIASRRALRSHATDPLTGLGARTAMRSELEALLHAFPTGQHAATFILDMDHFKSVNDTYGHQVGDAVLSQVGEIMRNFSSVGVRSFRIGGDEIGGYVVESSRISIVETLESINRAIAGATFKLDEASVRVTASMGFAFVDGETDIEDAFTNADQALYAAKEAGRNRVHPFDLTWEEAEEDPGVAAFAHFENVTKLWAERFASTVLSVGRQAFDVSRSSADRDGLTDLFTRRYFDRRMRREIANAYRDKTALSVILTDVDDFHDVNMTHGYPSGDAALRLVAEVAQNHSRSTDWLARYGGEEFCVIMPGADHDEAMMVASRIREAIASLTVEGFEGRTFSVTVSAGVASLTEIARSIEDADPLIQIASDRVITAKRSGKNRVVGE